jgi:protein disulfide-isomerase
LAPNARVDDDCRRRFFADNFILTMTRFALISLAVFVIAIGVGSHFSSGRASGGTSAASSASGESTWMTDQPAALAKAKAEGKTVLLDFTGSDWCIWCKRLDAEVFSQPEFKSYAEKNLVLVKLDFPRSTPQPAAEKRQNQGLAERYKIEGFPTIIVLNANGDKVGELGYMEGGAGPWLAELKKITKS